VPLGAAGRDVEEAPNAGLAGSLEHAGLVFGQTLVFEVAMAVDQHQAGSLSGSAMRGNKPCGLSKRKSLSASGEYQCDQMPSKVRISGLGPMAPSSFSIDRGMTGMTATASCAMAM